VAGESPGPGHYFPRPSVLDRHRPAHCFVHTSRAGRRSPTNIVRGLCPATLPADVPPSSVQTPSQQTATMEQPERSLLVATAPVLASARRPSTGVSGAAAAGCCWTLGHSLFSPPQQGPGSKGARQKMLVDGDSPYCRAHQRPRARPSSAVHLAPGRKARPASAGTVMVSSGAQQVGATTAAVVVAAAAVKHATAPSGVKVDARQDSHYKEGYDHLTRPRSGKGPVLRWAGTLIGVE
jgi:hypothetical protein